MSMAKNQEEIRATVPAGNAWHTEDIEAKAASYGMSKTKFILLAVDVFMNLSRNEIIKLEQIISMRRLIAQGIDINCEISLSANNGGG